MHIGMFALFAVVAEFSVPAIAPWYLCCRNWFSMGDNSSDLMSLMTFLRDRLDALDSCEPLVTRLGCCSGLLNWKTHEHIFSKKGAKLQSHHNSFTCRQMLHLSCATDNYDIEWILEP
jgi:hypothetical protein